MEGEPVYFHSADKLSHMFLKNASYYAAGFVLLIALSLSYLIGYFFYSEVFDSSLLLAFGLALAIVWVIFLFFSACYFFFTPTRESIFLTNTSILVVTNGLLCSQYTVRHPLSRRGGVKVEKVTKSSGHLPESFYKPELLQDETTPLKADALLTIKKLRYRRNPYISFSVGNGDELIEALSIVSGSAPDHSSRSLLPSTICKVFLAVLASSMVVLGVGLPLSYEWPTAFAVSFSPVFALYGIIIISGFLLIISRCSLYHHDFLFYVSPQ